ncbi:hypothetical protein G7046_g4327 [Stylonectria norvegica]|nr:hypothetical protein G7046_g4327 [Stylonectria norvegica]
MTTSALVVHYRTNRCVGLGGWTASPTSRGRVPTGSERAAPQRYDAMCCPSEWLVERRIASKVSRGRASPSRIGARRLGFVRSATPATTTAPDRPSRPGLLAPLAPLLFSLQRFGPCWAPLQRCQHHGGESTYRDRIRVEDLETIGDQDAKGGGVSGGEGLLRNLQTLRPRAGTPLDLHQADRPLPDELDTTPTERSATASRPLGVAGQLEKEIRIVQSRC